MIPNWPLDRKMTDLCLSANSVREDVYTQEGR